jgi:four helix bundle protein
MQDFRKLLVWQKNRALVADIYRATAAFPSDERFGLTSQMRRAVVGIGAAIAEGCGRGTRKDTSRFFQIAFGSSTELLHHLITAMDLGFLTQDQFGTLDAKLLEVRKMLASLMKRIRDT